MNRTLPTYEIAGKSFHVDVAKGELTDTADPDNSISFHDLRDKGDHYILYYHRRTGKLMVEGDISQGEQVQRLEIPPMHRLDPEGMARLYERDGFSIAGKTDTEIIINSEILDQRLKGILPRIDIAGNTFIIDYRLKELRSEQQAANRLPIGQMDVSADGNHYLFFYLPAKQQMIQMHERMKEIPDGLLQVKIPNELGLDPVGVAREYNITGTGFLRKYPPQSQLKAMSIPAKDCGLQEWIRQNNRSTLRKNNGKKL